MASTYLAPTCKPWLRFHRDTWRVNESPREAREHSLGTIKASTRMILVHVQKMYKTCTEDVQYI